MKYDTIRKKCTKRYQQATITTTTNSVHKTNIEQDHELYKNCMRARYRNVRLS